MANIPTETATPNCWENCPGFEVAVNRIYDGECNVVWQTRKCINLNICEHLMECLHEQELKREEKADV